MRQVYLRKQFCFFVFLISFLGNLNLEAQEVFWGPEVKTKGKSLFDDVYKVNGDRLVSLHVQKNPWKQRWDVVLNAFDKQSLSKTGESVVEMAYQKNNLSFVNSVLMGNDIVLYSTYHNTSKRKKYLFATRVDAANLKVKPIIKLSEVEIDNSHPSAFNLVYSSDTSRVAFTAWNSQKKDKPTLKVTLCDRNFNYIYDEEIPLTGYRGALGIKDQKLDSRGNLYLLLYAKRGRSEIDKSDLHEYHLVKINTLGTVELSQSLKVGDKIISDIDIVLDDEEIYLASLWSNEGGNSTLGYHYKRLKNSDFSLISEGGHEFNEDILFLGLSDRRLKKLNRTKQSDEQIFPELRHLNISEIIIRSDGGAVIISEISMQYVEYTRNSNMGFYPYSGFGFSPMSNRRDEAIYHYENNAALIFNVDAEANAEWQVIIPKFQHTINDRAYYNSFSKYTTRSELGFIFNDHPASTLNENNRHVFDGTGSAIKLVKVLSNGESSLEALKPMVNNMKLIPKACRQISRDEVILAANSNGRIHFGILRI